MISRMLACTLVLMALATGVARSGSPTFVSIDVNHTFESPAFSAFCGFEVDVTQVGTLKGPIFYDASGAQIISEIDTQPGFMVTLSSPASGKSFTFPFATAFHFEFPTGATTGSGAIVTAKGLIDKVPGIPADAGKVTYGNAKVLYIDASGAPRVDFGAPTAIDGNAVDPQSAIAALCAALAP